jgi:hypothetical protein
MKVAQRAGNTRGTGTRNSFRWQKSVGRIARLVLRVVARPFGENRALARRKLEAPPDAGHEPREGETVREQALTLKKYAQVRFAGFGSQGLGTTEGVLGLSPVLSSRAR